MNIHETHVDEKGEEGCCPFCHQREGPLRIGHNRFWFCQRHSLHWIGFESESAASKEEEAEARRLEAHTTTIRPSRAWRPPVVMAEIYARMTPEAIERVWPSGSESQSMVVEWPTADE